ncbi:Sec1-like protein [Blyttiomyces helicus]|uniref:Sec1-like protein n=1 Tax=Blyttiomyces helicus TaxID=388810 RepID=A0A4P9WAW3_9FUNG|nr:Sec1-like protein [Blyttiomyces helicus]|eukprot:RKO89604.1 Sec1-like protein [Blyttiomyces helicus]
MVKDVVPANGVKHKIIVVDAAALRVLNSVCKMSDLTDQGVAQEGCGLPGVIPNGHPDELGWCQANSPPTIVLFSTVVENISTRRAPYPNMEAIYFIAPEAASVQLFIEDFTLQKRPYAGAHIFCISAIPDSLLDRITRSPAANYIRGLKELYVDFFAPEPQVFTIEHPLSMRIAFNDDQPAFQKFELEKMAKKITSVLSSLGEYPHIRYYDPAASAGAKPSSTSKLALLVQAELDTLCRLDSKFPPVSRRQRAVFLIVDRSLDVMTPLMHDFAYQPFTGDLLGVEDGKYLPPGETNHAILDDSDVIWSQARHWHIAEVMDFLSEGLKQFTSGNKAAQWEMAAKEGTASIEKINALKDTLASLPQYQEMKAKEAMDVYKDRRLEKLVKIEQELATGETAEGKPSRTSLNDVISIMQDSKIE